MAGGEGCRRPSDICSSIFPVDLIRTNKTLNDRRVLYLHSRNHSPSILSFAYSENPPNHNVQQRGRSRRSKATVPKPRMNLMSFDRTFFDNWISSATNEIRGLIYPRINRYERRKSGRRCGREENDRGTTRGCRERA